VTQSESQSQSDCKAIDLGHHSSTPIASHGHLSIDYILVISDIFVSIPFWPIVIGAARDAHPPLTMMH